MIPEKIARIQTEYETDDDRRITEYVVITNDSGRISGFDTIEAAKQWISKQGYTYDLNAPFNKYPL